MKSSQVLIINGSIRGDEGNSARIVHAATGYFRKKNITVSVLTLAGQMPSVEEIRQQVEEADSLLLVSGVYWHN
ncbi:MAG: hypothetical protein DI535_09450 [Citrobacter freundii]|nr:MAG: hypothetical protein DI535_09450 [Citrobacter freundii]